MKYWLPAMAFLALLLATQAAYAQDAAYTENRQPPLAYLLLPGGTHFYDGDTAEGLAFSLSEVSLLATGLLIGDSLEQDERHELNVPLLLAGQVYAVDKWRYFQKRRERLPFKVDSTPVSELLSAPFNPGVILSPLVLTFAALGIVDGMVAYPGGNKTYSDISGVTAMGSGMDRGSGTLYYEGASFAVSYGAAVSEEMMFRGLMLPVLDYEWGKGAGLTATSLTFGLLHLLNPDVDRPLYFVTQATVAGFIFGRHVQKNDYRLSKAIAAHFWYNFASATTTWLMNPEENPLGVGVSFEF